MLVRYCWLMERETIDGGCLCGAFQFRITGPLTDVRLCHCDLCRRANGSAFSANSRVPVSHFAVVRQAAPISEFQSSPGAWKCFCSVCGSPVYSKVEWDAEFIRVRLGTLPGMRRFGLWLMYGPDRKQRGIISRTIFRNLSKARNSCHSGDHRHGSRSSIWLMGCPFPIRSRMSASQTCGLTLFSLAVSRRE